MKKNSLYVSNIITDVLKNLSLTTKDTKFLLLILKSMSKNRLFFQKLEDHYLNKEFNLKITNIFDDQLKPFIEKIEDTVVFSRKEFMEITGVHHTTINREAWLCWDNIHAAKIELIDKDLYKGVSGNLFIDFNNLSNGDFKIRVTEYMKRLFALLFQYTELHLPYISVLKKHSLTMYLICKVEQKKWNKRFVKKETTIEFALDSLKETLKVPASYNISMLKKNVLDKIENSFKNTDLNLRYELIKTGRKVTKVNIIFSPNKEDLLNEPLNSDKNSVCPEEQVIDEKKLKDKLILMGISKTDAMNYINDNGLDLVESVYDKVIKANQSNKIKTSLSGYFIKSLRNEIQILSEVYFLQDIDNKISTQKITQNKVNESDYNLALEELCNYDNRKLKKFQELVRKRYPRIKGIIDSFEKKIVPMNKETFNNFLKDEIKSCMSIDVFINYLAESNLD